VEASPRTYALKGAAAVPAVQTGTASSIPRYGTVLIVQTGTASLIRRYRTVLCCTGRSDRYSLTKPQVQGCTVLYRPFRQVRLINPQIQDCTALYRRSDRYSFTNPQVQDCTVLYWSFRQLQLYQSTGPGLYSSELAVHTGTDSPVGKYRTVLCCTGRLDRYRLTSRQVQGCTVLYWSFRQVQAYQSPGTGLYCAVLLLQTGTASPTGRYRAVLCCTSRSDRYNLTSQVQDHQSAGTGLYCAVTAVQTGTTSPIRRYRTVLCCTGRSDRYNLTNPQVQDCTVLYRPFRQVQSHQSAGTGLYYAVLAVQTGTASPIRRHRAILYCAVPFRL
jgi:hypothetical protein